jgi:ABC-type multidrug transport system ATPase subunit
MFLQGRLYGMSRYEVEKRANELLNIFELTDMADRAVRTYSGGQKRQLLILVRLSLKVHRLNSKIEFPVTSYKSDFQEKK